MPSVTYMNQSAPFWDFLASLEQQGNQHPFFAQNRNDETENEHDHEDAEGYEGHEGPSQPFAPWNWGQFFGGPGGMAHRGPPPRGHHGGHHGPHHGPHPHGPPPHHHPHHDDESGETDPEKEKAGEKDALMNDDNDNNNDNGEGPSGNSGSDNEGRSHGRGHHGRCGGGRRGRCGPGGPGGFGGRHGPPHHGPGRRHGPPHHGPGAFHGPSHHGRHHGFGGPRCPRGPRGRHGPFGFGGFSGGPFGGLFDPSTIAAQFWSQFNDTHPSNKKDNAEPEDHSPEADIFDTETAFVVHVSLPGAKKEDVGVNWDAEKSELSIAGVIYRPGDEEFLKTLAMDERKVGAFDRKVRLGTRATPAHIDADGITAKLEDGVLRVEVPKLDSGYVEIRKVDIE